MSGTPFYIYTLTHDPCHSSSALNSLAYYFLGAQAKQFGDRNQDSKCIASRLHNIGGKQNFIPRSNDGRIHQNNSSWECQVLYMLGKLIWNNDIAFTTRQPGMVVVISLLKFLWWMKVIEFRYFFDKLLAVAAVIKLERTPMCDLR